MFSLLPLESLAAMPFGIPADPWACPASAGCRYQYHAKYAPPAPRPVRRVVRVAPRPAPPAALDPAVRIIQENWGVAILMECPYFSKDEISVEAKNDSLEVSASTGPSYYYRTGAFFSQNFRLGANIDAEAIGATYRGGVLTLRLPYKPRKPDVRRIVVQGSNAPAPCLVTPEPDAAAALPAPTAEAPPPAADVPKEPVAQQVVPVDVPNNVDEEGEMMPELEPLLQDVDPAEAAAAAAAAKAMTRDEKAAAWVAKHSVAGAVDDEEDGSIEECDVDA